MKKNKFYCHKNLIYFIIPILSVVIGLIGELVYNFPIQKQRDYEYIPIENIEMDNFDLVNGSEFVSYGGNATLTVSFEKKYIDKFRFHFEYDTTKAMGCDLIVHSYPDGEHAVNEVIRDSNNWVLNNSIVNIRMVADAITISMPADSSDVKISLIAIDNTGNYSIARIAFVSMVSFFALCVCIAIKRRIYIKIETIFVVMSCVIGVFTIAVMPAHKVGFDEEIHFGRAYFFAETIANEERIEYPFGIQELITTSLSNWPYHLAASEEEIKEENEYRNFQGDYLDERDDVIRVENSNYALGLHTYTYVFQWFMIKIGMLLRLPFVIVYKMGRLANLILYTILIYLAIHHMKKGKRIMFVLALMPTSMMSAVTYSYDGWVNGFAFLGCAYLLEEWFGDNEKISFRNYMVSVIALIFSCLPKAIYCPLLLLTVFFPASKFKNRKSMYILKGISIVSFVLMAGTFMMPALSNPVQMGGDSRGGDTSVARQLEYIFKYPLHYAKLLLTSIKDTLISYAIGIEGLGRMGHLEVTAREALTAMGVGYVVLTDSYNTQSPKIKLWQRSAIIVVCFGIICLIWTALYLSFTPVGLNQINGVQGRYYLPVTIWVLWALRTDKFKNHMSNEADNVVLVMINLLILLPVLYNNIVINAF